MSRDLEQLITKASEKPTPMHTETLIPTVIIPTSTVFVSKTATITPSVAVEPTSTVED